MYSFRSGNLGFCITLGGFFVCVGNWCFLESSASWSMGRLRHSWCSFCLLYSLSETCAVFERSVRGSQSFAQLSGVSFPSLLLERRLPSKGIVKLSASARDSFEIEMSSWIRNSFPTRLFPLER